MGKKEENFSSFARIIAVLLLFGCAMSVMVARLVDLQIVNGEEYAARSDRRLVTRFTVPASRGELLDRYGRPLVTNKQVFQLQFEYAYWDRSRQNEVILSLCRLLEAAGEAYEDSLPITRQAPFGFIGGEDSTARTQLNAYGEEQKLGENLSAEEWVDALSELYGIDPTLSAEDRRTVAGVRYEMKRRGFSAYNTFTFSSDVSIETVSRVKENHLEYPGVRVETAPVREYQTDYAAHILGRVDVIYKEEYPEYKEKGYPMNAIIGKDGMEKSLEDWLRGISGTRTVETDLAGRVVAEVSSKAPVPGNNCLLTLDLSLQETAERSLAENINRIKKAGEERKKNGAADIEGGAAVVLSANTGEILAMANYPTYHLATFRQDYKELAQDPLTPMYNRSIAGTYPPGSTFKMVTALAGLEEGVITPNTIIRDTGVYRYYAPSYTPACWVYNDYGYGHGNLNVSGAIRVSCNYFFFEVGRLLGIDRLNSYAKKLGLGQKTGVELAGERAGLLAGPEQRAATGGAEWQDGETIQAAIGQTSQAFTPLQLAAYVATIVNGGTYYRPHLLKSVQSYDYGAVVYENQPEAVNRIDIDPDNYQALMEGMRSVTEDGTASSVFRDFPIAVGGKTGSAQTQKNRSAHGVFVAFAPYDNPEIVVCVIGEHAGSGNQMAYVARDIFEAYFAAQGELSAVEEKNTLLP